MGQGQRQRSQPSCTGRPDPQMLKLDGAPAWCFEKHVCSNAGQAWALRSRPHGSALVDFKRRQWHHLPSIINPWLFFITLSVPSSIPSPKNRYGQPCASPPPHRMQQCKKRSTPATRKGCTAPPPEVLGTIAGGGNRGGGGGAVASANFGKNGKVWHFSDLAILPWPLPPLQCSPHCKPQNVRGQRRREKKRDFGSSGRCQDADLEEVGGGSTSPSEPPATFFFCCASHLSLRRRGAQVWGDGN